MGRGDGGAELKRGRKRVKNNSESAELSSVRQSGGSCGSKTVPFASLWGRIARGKGADTAFSYGPQLEGVQPGEARLVKKEGKKGSQQSQRGSRCDGGDVAPGRPTHAMQAHADRSELRSSALSRSDGVVGCAVGALCPRVQPAASPPHRAFRWHAFLLQRGRGLHTACSPCWGSGGAAQRLGSAAMRPRSELAIVRVT